MAQAAQPISQKESRLGRLSLFFLATGVVAPLLPLSGVEPDVIAVGFRIVFLVLALVFGILSRRSRAGRVGLIGSAVALGVLLILVITLFFWHAVRAVPSIGSPAPR